MAQHRVELGIRSGWRAIQELGFFAALKETVINENTRLFCLDDVARTGDFAASGASDTDFHRAITPPIHSEQGQPSLLDFRLTDCFPP
jgi:hypothetical protein